MQRPIDRGLESAWWLFLVGLVALAVASSGCASTMRPDVGATDFMLTPEQCLALKKERRAYRATEQTSVYIAGAGAVLTGIALAFTSDKAAPAAATSVTLVSGAVGAFTGSQVEGLDSELADGKCGR